jgi:hypothetical protein
LDDRIRQWWKAASNKSALIGSRRNSRDNNEAASAEKIFAKNIWVGRRA